MSFLTPQQEQAARAMCAPVYDNLHEACIASTCNRTRIEAMLFKASTRGLHQLQSLSEAQLAELRQYHDSPAEMPLQPPQPVDIPGQESDRDILAQLQGDEHICHECCRKVRAPERFKTCTKCHRVRFCSQQCLQQAWKHGDHKQLCKELQSAGKDTTLAAQTFLRNALQLSRPRLAAHWLGSLVRHLSAPTYSTAMRCSLSTLFWFVWHFTKHAVPHYLLTRLQEGLAAIRPMLARQMEELQLQRDRNGSEQELLRLLARLVQLCDWQLWDPPVRDGELLSCSLEPMRLLCPEDSTVAASTLAMQIVAMSSVLVLRGEHAYPPEYGDTGPLMNYSAQVCSSVRGLGLLASALGPATAPAVCQQLCKPLSTADWHARVLITWHEAKVHNKAPGARQQRRALGLPAAFQRHSERTGIGGALCEHASFTAAMRANALASVPRNERRRASQSADRDRLVWSSVVFRDYYPHDGLRAHETLPEMVKQDGSGEALLLCYCTRGVQVEMLRRGGHYAELLRRQQAEDIIMPSALPIALAVPLQA